MKRVLIAGGTGYLGRHVLREVRKQGYVVRALVRDPRRIEDLREFIDEIHVGEITNPESLEGICDGVDVVFSSVGITRQRDGLTYDDVDYQGNVNLLAEASRAGVSRFVYVSVFAHQGAGHVRIIAAKRRFESHLIGSGIDYVIVRPNGFFSDMTEFLSMAQKGRGFLFGTGSFRINPIHGEDLARICVDSFRGSDKEIEVGGPEVLTHNEIINVAFRTLHRDPRVSYVPVWIVGAAIKLLRSFSTVKTYGPVEFMTTALTRDMVAPRYGERRLADFFAETADQGAVEVS